MNSTQQFKESKRLGTKRALVDIDDTICFYPGKRRYDLSEPNFKNIFKINTLYDKGWEIIYWTARGNSAQIDYYEHTKQQLGEWGCKYHDLITGMSPNPKPSFDLIIDDKSLRIEDLNPQPRGFVASCFDLLHAGHVLMLKDCKNVCDYLIAALQSDPTLDRSSKNKPIQSLEERRLVLESIKYVDEVIIYHTEADLLGLLKKVNPEIRILGSDWKDKSFTGLELSIPIHWHRRDHNYSTTDLRNRIQSSC